MNKNTLIYAHTSKHSYARSETLIHSALRHTHTHTRVRAHAHTHTHTHAHTSTRARTHTYKYAYIRSFSQSSSHPNARIHARTHTYTHAHTYTKSCKYAHTPLHRYTFYTLLQPSRWVARGIGKNLLLYIQGKAGRYSPLCLYAMPILISSKSSRTSSLVKAILKL